MYTFRILSGDHVVTNHDLGNSYTVSYPGSIPYSRETGLVKKDQVKNIKSVIHGENGFSTFIEEGSACFIMTDSGKTFERL